MEMYTTNHTNYLLVIDCYSDFWEPDSLSDTTAATIIQTKETFQTPKPEAMNPRLCTGALCNLPIHVIVVNITSPTYLRQSSCKAQLPIKTAKII